MTHQCPEPPDTVTREYEQYFQAGFRSGVTPEAPFNPEINWSSKEKQAYAIGFDLGIDALIDTLFNT